jgi:drug/metabolite transporter (DMT)-like permease
MQIDQHFGQSVDDAAIEYRLAAAAWMISLRFSLASILFIPFFPTVVRRVRTPHFVAGVAIGFTFFLGLIMQVVGLATIPASRSGFLTSLTVVFVPLMTTALGRRIPRISVLLAGAIAMLGVSILTDLVRFDSGGIAIADDALAKWTLGDSLTVLGAVFFGVQIILIDWYGRKYDSVAFTPSVLATTAVCGWSLLGITLFALPAGSSQSAIGEWMNVGAEPAFFGLIILLAIFPALVAFAWMNKYQPAVSAIQAGIIYTLEPVFASTFAMFMPAILSAVCLVSYPNETFTLPLLVGGITVIFANLLALWPDRPLK